LKNLKEEGIDLKDIKITDNFWSKYINLVKNEMLPYQWKVLNERDILRAGESKHRPDRVMLKENDAVVVDYKTGEISDKDIRQMKGYLTDLRSMGFENCEGNIWYLQKNEIIKVELSS